MSYLNTELLTKLRDRCLMGIDQFRELGDCVDTPDGPMIHIDNGGDVLGVAHLDWVDWTKPTHKRGIIRCPQLDDRLGVWVLLDLLPSMGIKADILLTDSEECGRSTAGYYQPAKPYNWIYQFDRRGTDTVLYEYDSEENRERLEKHGLKCGYGSFSDICKLEHMGVSGWNIGTGYHNEHSRRCFADLKDTFANAVKFMSFFREHSTTKIDAPPPRTKWSSKWSGYKSASLYGWGVEDDYSDNLGKWDKETSTWTPATKKIILPDDPFESVEEDAYMNSEDWECLCSQINPNSDLYCTYCGTAVFDLPPDREAFEEMRWDCENETWHEYLMRTGGKDVRYIVD